MPLATIVPLVVFVALMLLTSLQALSASGHFPKTSRLPALAQGSGPMVLWTSIVVTAGSVVAGIAAAWMLVPWYAAVIGGGAARSNLSKAYCQAHGLGMLPNRDVGVVRGSA